MPSGDIIVANPPAGWSPVVVKSDRPDGYGGDYAWTSSPAVEGLMILLTAVAVPVAIVRWTRRFRRSGLGARYRRWKPPFALQDR